MFGLFGDSNAQAEKWHNKALDAMRGHDFIKSFNCYMESVKLNPNNPIVWYEMSVLSGQHGHDWKKAKQCVEKALSIEPENFPQAWKGLAIIEKQLGNTDRAIEIFKMLMAKYGWKPTTDPTVKEPELRWLSEHGVV